MHEHIMQCNESLKQSYLVGLNNKAVEFWTRAGFNFSDA